MEAFVRAPEPLSAVGDMAHNWQRWKKDFQIYLEVSNNIKKSKDIKAYLLRSHIGIVGQSAINKIIPNDSKDKDDINVLLKILDTHFIPPKNELIERYNFFTRSKKRDETFENYIDDLKKIAANCNFGNMINSLIRDRVIADIKYKDLRTKLFAVENLDLSTLISIINSHREGTFQKKQNSSNITNANKKTINNIGSQQMKNVNNNDNNNNDNLNDDTKLLRQYQESKSNRRCWKCHQSHAIRNCPAWGFKCEICGERNHYTTCCKNKRSETDKFKTNLNNTLNPQVNPERENLQTNFMQNNTGPYAGPSHHGLPNAVHPSAPQLSQIEFELYPNLNHMKTTNEASPNTWSWIEQKNTKSNEKFQKNEHSELMSKPKGNNNISKGSKIHDKDSCNLS